jgi:hypothetical protein
MKNKRNTHRGDEMTKTECLKRLEKLNACSEARDWARSQRGDAAAIWRRCKNPQWMLWLLEAIHAPDSLLRHLAADFVTESARFAEPDGECAIAWCVDVVRRWADGAVEQDEIAAAWAAAGAAAGAAQCDLIRARVSGADMVRMLGAA